MKKDLKIAIVGATGAVGLEIVNVLHKRSHPSPPILLASHRSAGKVLETAYGPLTVQEFKLDQVRSNRYDVIFLAVSGGFALEYAQLLSAPYDDNTDNDSGDDKAPWVIDNSSAFRLDPKVPLMVPEINGDIGNIKSRLIANPNCTTAIAAMVLWPLYQHFGGIKKCILSTYQAASGAGAEGMKELKEGCAYQLETGDIPQAKVFAHPLPFNVIPHIDKFQDNGYTKEEMKVTWETQKIFSDPNMNISCTAVRIPTLRAHSESITIETNEPISPDKAREILLESPGVMVWDDPSQNLYPMPLNVSGQDDVQVGRIRQLP